MEELNLFSLNDVFKELSYAEKDGKINLYALRHVHRPKTTGNFVVSLPSNQNAHFLKQYCRSLKGFEGFECCKFDPIGKKDNTYECIPLDRISVVWADIASAIDNSEAFKDSPNREFFSSINLTICELVYTGKKLWLGTQQQKTESLFKGRTPFLATESELELIELKDIITLSFNVDFIVNLEESPAIVYVFNRKNFVAIFNFYDALREHVQSKSRLISKWSFLENPWFIQEKIELSHVFKGLSRIIDDAAYLQQMQTTQPHILKERLLEKGSGLFSEKDFQGDKLKVTRSNLGNIIKMISKEFRYNFFADKAEELK
jgi:hypothetical protein